jgi:hypothetical protein
MAIIHFIGGEKGGVGKSLFTRILAAYCQNHAKQVTLVDADPKGDVHSTCGGKQIVFSEAEDKLYDADDLFQLALTESLIVNLPSNVSEAMNGWIERNRVLKLGAEHGVGIFHWFVCTGQQQSLEELVASLKQWQGELRHVIVRNQVKFSSDGWATLLDEPSIKTALSSCSYFVEMPILSRKERDYLENNRVSFVACCEPKHREALGILGLMRVKGFLEDMYASIDPVWTSIEASAKGTSPAIPSKTKPAGKGQMTSPTSSTEGAHAAG